ncbi:MAG: M67 family metallopeptidase [Alphaproteobacteria bacterium]|nr:M67 family metallopeptidase [Alphaproteobacteria bacterium]MDE2013527.1 M67 family metallopeptidase [Alphaproteobacteria bacterium]MDE2073361.1 M67 family metallopeptidase [Alphaproteobacteria bacterium]MDE2351051.1 M67 family metallopeptidase [Alphaproteobacteria bacterium]
MTVALILPEALRAQLAAEARAAFPAECCGLIEGQIEGEEAAAAALHPTKNLAAGPDRFEIDPAEHVRLLRALRGSGRDIIGCYHSHPNGQAEPSPRDRESAAEAGFVWLIVALTGERILVPTAFVFAGGGFRPLVLRP